MFALGAHADPEAVGGRSPARLTSVGRGLTLTCRESYRFTPTGLGPDNIHFGGNVLQKGGGGGGGESR